MGLTWVASIISTPSAYVSVDRANWQRSNRKTTFSTRGGSGCRGFVGSIGGWGIHESAALTLYLDDAAQHLGLIHTAHTSRVGKEGLDPLKLFLTEPEQALHPSTS